VAHAEDGGSLLLYFRCAYVELCLPKLVCVTKDLYNRETYVSGSACNSRYYVMNTIFCSVVLSLIQGIAHNTGVPP
jgi:hypothetical protein